MARCESYEALMSQLMDEGLTQEQESALRDHLRTCPRCAAVFSAMSGITVALREDQAEPPAELAAGVMARIAGERDAAPVLPAEEDPLPEAPEEDLQEPEEDDEPLPLPKSPPAGRHRTGRRPALWIRAAAAACLVLIVSGAALTVFRSRMGRPGGTASVRTEEDALAPVPAAGAAAYDAETAEAAQAMPAARSAAADPLDVKDIAGNSIGYIPGEQTAAFAAFLEDGGDAGQGWEMLCTVNYQGTDYAFATDDEAKALVWWDTADGTAHYSSGTWAALRAMIVSTVDTQAGQ